MKSWGHDIQRLLSMGEGLVPATPGPCSGPRCPEPAQYLASYAYITGRTGRQSLARRHLCFRHAQRFAGRYGLFLEGL